MATVRFDHTIVPSTDEHRSARFSVDLLELGDVRVEPPFACADLGNEATLAAGGSDTAPVAGEINHDDGGRPLRYGEPT